MTKHRVLIVAGSLLTLAVMATPAVAQSKCSALQYKAMGKKYLAKLKCHSKAVTQNVPVDATCLTNAEDKFATKWAAALDKGDCLAVVSEAQGESAVDACVADATALLEPPPVCPVDGSGTACNAFAVVDSDCENCCFGAGVACSGACSQAGVLGCLDSPENQACAVEINNAGCADECCP